MLTKDKDGLEKGLTYRVRYRAVNEIGEGPWSDVTRVRAATLPQAPPSPKVTAADETKITLNLLPTSDDGGTAGGSLFFYRLYSNEGTDGSPFHAVSNLPSAPTTFTANAGAAIGASGKTFAAGKIYTFKLTAINEVGESELRYQAPTVRIAMGAVPATPTQPTFDVSATNETQISLTWVQPAPTGAMPVQRLLLWSDMAIPGSSHVILNTT